MYEVFYLSKGEENVIMVEASGNYEAICKAMDLIPDKRAVIYKWVKK